MYNVKKILVNARKGKHNLQFSQGCIVGMQTLLNGLRLSICQTKNCLKIDQEFVS